MNLEELIDRARRALSAGAAMRLAVLFGSHATGRAGPGSDVDIAMIPADSSLSLWDECRIAADLEDLVGLPVDLVRLDLAPTLVRWEVVKSGIPILADPPQAWPSLVARVFAEHADYAPAAERIARSYLDRLAQQPTAR